MGIETNYNMPWAREKVDNGYKAPYCGDSNLNGIDHLYFTDDREEDRTTFDGTFYLYNTQISDAELSSGATQGYNFYKSLIDCKYDNYGSNGLKRVGLMEKLNLTSEEYDSLACIALAIASQETGMGGETGYKKENTKFGDIDSFADFGDFLYTNARKAFITVFGENSASSGITQLKIYDQIQDMDEWHKGILREYGIEAKNKGYDNLAKDPEKSAVATMVVLKLIKDNYDTNVNNDEIDSYKATMDKAFNEMQNEYSSKGISNEDALNKGFDKLADIYNYYQNTDEETKLAIRTAFKDVFLAANDTTLKDKKGNSKQFVEEYQINQLNDALGGNIEFTKEDLGYIRFAMCSEEAQMDVSEYCAYAWNKGTGRTGMQIDRLISEKLGIIFSDPEDFDYNQYTANVVTIATHYSNQITEDENGYFLLNEPFEKDEE